MYFMGIIDILQEYDAKKFGETVLKTVLLRQPRLGLSAVPPKEYAARFVAFIDGCTS